MTKKGALIILVGVAAVIAAGLFWQRKGETHTLPVVRGPAVEVVYATGSVEPVRMVELRPESAGRLDELLKDDGDKVVAGEVLARLDRDGEQAEVAQWEAKKRLDEISLQRAESLRQKSAGSQETLDIARSALKQTEAQLAQAQERLDRRELRSPIGGTVLRRDGEAGEVLTTTSRVFVVGDLTDLRVELEVDEDDVPRLAPGQKVYLTADAFPGQALPASISDITPLGDTNNKSYRVRATLAKDTPLKVGMTVEANIVVREVQSALLVPASALKGDKVVTPSGEQAVKLGIRGPDYVEVLEGLSEGDKVIVPESVAKAPPPMRQMP